jgi:hypothetical protein
MNHLLNHFFQVQVHPNKLHKVSDVLAQPQAQDSLEGLRLPEEIGTSENEAPNDHLGKGNYGIEKLALRPVLATLWSLFLGWLLLGRPRRVVRIRQNINADFPDLAEESQETLKGQWPALLLWSGVAEHAQVCVHGHACIWPRTAWGGSGHTP